MSEKKCTNSAFYRYTWPGNNESYICTEHINKLKAIANAMGLYLQIIELSYEEQRAHTCGQIINGEHSK